MEPMITITRKEYDTLLNNSNQYIHHMISSTTKNNFVKNNFVKIDGMPPEIDDESLQLYLNEMEKKYDPACRSFVRKCILDNSTSGILIN